MDYESEYLTEEENLFVKENLEHLNEIKCMTIAQVYTYDQYRMNNWSLLSTGVLYLGRNNKTWQMGLFHLLKIIIDWEEEVYEEMILDYKRDRILCSEGKRQVFLLNFLSEDECQLFLKIFDEIQGRNVETEPEHEYERISAVFRFDDVIRKKDNKKKSSFWKIFKSNKKKSTKNEKSNEARKKLISCPNLDTFEHITHAGFTSEGFVIEGMDIKEVEELMKKMGISCESKKQNAKFINSFVEKTHKHTINEKDKIVRRYITEFPPIQEDPHENRISTPVTMQFELQNRRPQIMENNSISPNLRQEIKLKPNLSVKPEVKSKPLLKTKPELKNKPAVSSKPVPITSKPEFNEMTPSNMSKRPLVQIPEEAPISQNVPPVPKMDLSQNTRKMSTTVSNDRSDFLAEIHRKTKLRHVEAPSSEKTKTKTNDSVLAVISRNLPANKNLEQHIEEEQTYFAKDEWE